MPVPMMILTAAVVFILLGLNLTASAAIVKDQDCERRQRAAQLLIVWLLPLVGSLLVLGVRRPQEEPARRYRGEPDPGSDFGMSGRAWKGVKEAAGAD